MITPEQLAQWRAACERGCVGSEEAIKAGDFALLLEGGLSVLFDQRKMDREAITAGIAAVAELEDENAALVDEVSRLTAERDALRAEVERLKTAIADLRYAFDDPVVVERIAAWSHKSWAGWYRWMAEKWGQIHHGTGESFQERWKRQSETPYVKLSDSEQRSDRTEAKEVLNVLYGIMPWPRFESEEGETKCASTI